MTKNERIDQLERLVSDLSRRTYDLERRTGFVYYPRTYPWQPSYTSNLLYYCSNGESKNLATEGASGTGSVSSKAPTTSESRLGTDSGGLGNGATFTS